MAKRRRFKFMACGAAALSLAMLSCAREERNFREAASVSDDPSKHLRMNQLRPGGGSGDVMVTNPYENSAYSVSQGQQLYNSFNCSGCHFNGGGGIGPPLMDDKWIYGGEPQNIYATIMEGRPNGMPSFRDKIPPDAAWKIVAYVRSLSGQLPRDVAPSRQDHLSGRSPEANTPREHPKSNYKEPGQ
jgi:cytochrome c oxidase cbb3-type subunit III